MIVTINQIEDQLEYFASNHRQINDFHFGQWIDAINKDVPAKYPLMCTTVINSQMPENLFSLNMGIILADKFTRGDFRQQNIIISNLAKVASNLRAYFRNWELQDYVNVGTISIEPFFEDGKDLTCGWALTVQLDILDRENYCEIPYVEEPIFPPIIQCAPVQLLLNGDEWQQIKSGKEVNVELKYVDGDIVVPISFTDTEIVVPNSAITKLHDWDSTNNYSYCGTAEGENVPPTEVFSIARIEVFLDGTTEVKFAVGIWNNREILNYN